MNEQIEPKSTKRGRGKGYQSKYHLPSEVCSLKRMLTILKNIVEAAREGDKYQLIDTPKVVSATGEIRTDVSRHLPFFSQAGLIEQAGKGKLFKPTQEAVDFANAQHWDPDEAKTVLRRAFEDKWFTRVVNSALKEGKTLTRAELVSKLGRATTAGDLPLIVKKLERLIDLLGYAEYISENAKTKEIRLATAPSMPAGSEEEASRKKGMLEEEPEKGRPVVDQQWGEKDSRVRLLVFSKEPLKPEAFKMIAEISEKIEELAAYLQQSKE